MVSNSYQGLYKEWKMEISPGGLIGMLCIGALATLIAGLILNVLIGSGFIIEKLLKIPGDIFEWFINLIKQIFLKLGFSERASLNLAVLIIFVLLILVAFYSYRLQMQ